MQSMVKAPKISVVNSQMPKRAGQSFDLWSHLSLHWSDTPCITSEEGQVYDLTWAWRNQEFFATVCMCL